MKRERSTRAKGRVAIAAISLLGLAAISAPAMASSVSHSSQPSGAIRLTRVATDAAATRAYWTPDRIRSAIPVGVVSAGTAAPKAAAQKPTGTPGKVAGHAPTGRTNATAARGASPAESCSPAACPYDSFEVTPAGTKKSAGIWKTFPYDVNGKLFFTNDGADYVCSGTVIGASNPSDQNEIWTAGHCLANTESNTGVFDDSAIFVPGFNGNAPVTYTSVKKEEAWAPFGVFTWDGSSETATAWLNNRDFTEDEAAMQFDPSDLTGETLGQAVGYAGFAWNYPVNEQFIAFGYPADSPYNGNLLEEDIATTGGQDGNGGADGTDPLYIGSPFTGGSSGGAWTFDWATDGTGYVDGHNDYTYSNQADTMYSPYQDSLSNLVRCLGATSC